MDSVYSRVARRRRRGQGGFTLIELLVVIAVLAVLAGIVIFNVAGVANRGASSSCATDVKSVQTASDAYYNDHAQTYPTGGSTTSANLPLDPSLLLVPTYLHTTPGNGEKFHYTDASGTVAGQYVVAGALTAC
jgi:prepilin-type N-terminal cleavage/methylation domain-containing protein